MRFGGMSAKREVAQAPSAEQARHLPLGGRRTRFVGTANRFALRQKTADICSAESLVQHKEKPPAWREALMRLLRQALFDDFVNVSAHLCEAAMDLLVGEADDHKVIAL